MAQAHVVPRLRVGTRMLAAFCSSEFAAVAPASAHASGRCAIQLEYLDRGLVAAAPSQGIFLSWRLLRNEVTGHTDTGRAGADFMSTAWRGVAAQCARDTMGGRLP